MERRKGFKLYMVKGGGKVVALATSAGFAIDGERGYASGGGWRGGGL